MVLRRTDLLSPAASFEQLINEAIRRGIDVIDLLSKALDLDPGRRAVAHWSWLRSFLMRVWAWLIRTQLRRVRSYIRLPRRPLRPWR